MSFVQSSGKMLQSVSVISGGYVGFAKGRTFYCHLGGQAALLRSSSEQLKRSIHATKSFRSSAAQYASAIEEPKRNSCVVGPDGMLQFFDGPKMNPIFLRDACTCSQCVDSSTRQKNFETEDIPENLRPILVDASRGEGVHLKWENDIRGYGPDHVSHIPSTFFHRYAGQWNDAKALGLFQERQLWDKEIMTKEFQFFHYDDYMAADSVLFQALEALRRIGLVLIRGVPNSETSVEAIAGRIGTLRDTFYGRTWNVRTVPQAKNVAYTAKYLGLHMDLLYLANPPKLQFLHCLNNSCQGGSSIFSDGLHAAKSLSLAHRQQLSENTTAFHYDNDGEHYYHAHRFFEVDQSKWDGSWELIEKINWSPPFQTSVPYHPDLQGKLFTEFLTASRAFAAEIQDPKNMLEYRLQEGECVIFDNRRLLHGRKEFDSAVGERLLKGAYVDEDPFMSRYRVLRKDLQGKDMMQEGRGQPVFPTTQPEACSNPVA